MSRKLDHVMDDIIREVLRWTDEDTDLARQVAEKLVTLDWQQILFERQQKEVSSQMRAMSNFLEWRERGGGFCDDCKEDNYVGGYHRGPMYEKVYSWPHAISAYSPNADDAQGRRYCRKCFWKMQDDLVKHLLRERQEGRPELLVRSHFHWMYRCDECGRLIPRRSAYQIPTKDNENNLYCLHCVEKAVERQFTFCQICDKKTANSTNGYCYDCYPIQRAYGLQVSNHLGRARAAGTPATLTVPQWVAALEYFHEKCAYCQLRPAQVVEHFISISAGGGTTAENCVPACQRCNNRKGDKPPERLTEIFPVHAIERIKAYLQGDKPSLKVRPSSCRALVVQQQIQEAS